MLVNKMILTKQNRKYNLITVKIVKRARLSPTTIYTTTLLGTWRCWWSCQCCTKFLLVMECSTFLLLAAGMLNLSCDCCGWLGFQADTMNSSAFKCFLSLTSCFLDWSMLPSPALHFALHCSECCLRGVLERIATTFSFPFPWLTSLRPEQAKGCHIVSVSHSLETLKKYVHRYQNWLMSCEVDSVVPPSTDFGTIPYPCKLSVIFYHITPCES